MFKGIFFQTIIIFFGIVISSKSGAMEAEKKAKLAAIKAKSRAAVVAATGRSGSLIQGAPTPAAAMAASAQPDPTKIHSRQASGPSQKELEEIKKKEADARQRLLQQEAELKRLAQQKAEEEKKKKEEEAALRAAKAAEEKARAAKEAEALRLAQEKEKFEREALEKERLILAQIELEKQKLEAEKRAAAQREAALLAQLEALRGAQGVLHSQSAIPPDIAHLQEQNRLLLEQLEKLEREKAGIGAAAGKRWHSVRDTHIYTDNIEVNTPLLQKYRHELIRFITALQQLNQPAYLNLFKVQITSTQIKEKIEGLLTSLGTIPSEDSLAQLPPLNQIMGSIENLSTSIQAPLKNATIPREFEELRDAMKKFSNFFKDNEHEIEKALSRLEFQNMQAMLLSGKKQFSSAVPRLASIISSIDNTLHQMLQEIFEHSNCGTCITMLKDLLKHLFPTHPAQISRYLKQAQKGMGQSTEEVLIIRAFPPLFQNAGVRKQYDTLYTEFLQHVKGYLTIELSYNIKYPRLLLFLHQLESAIQTYDHFYDQRKQINTSELHDVEATDFLTTIERENPLTHADPVLLKTLSTKAENIIDSFSKIRHPNPSQVILYNIVKYFLLAERTSKRLQEDDNVHPIHGKGGAHMLSSSQSAPHAPSTGAKAAPPPPPPPPGSLGKK